MNGRDEFLFVLVFEKSSNQVKVFSVSPNEKDLDSDRRKAVEEAVLWRNRELQDLYPSSLYEVVIGKTDKSDSVADVFPQTIGWDQIIPETFTV